MQDKKGVILPDLPKIKNAQKHRPEALHGRTSKTFPYIAYCC